MIESAPLVAPGGRVGIDTLPGVLVDDPDLAALIDFKAGIPLIDVVIEESAAVVPDDLDRQINLLASLTLGP